MNGKIFLIIALLLNGSCASQKTAHQARGKEWVGAFQGEYAAEAAEEIKKAGGNIVDQAVASSFVLAVERPQSTGIGGGGFMILALKSMKRPIAIDFREKAPLLMDRSFYLRKKDPLASRTGIFAAAVPGLVSGLYFVHQNYGKLPWKDLLAPAIRLAREGFAVYEELSAALSENEETLGKFPASRKIFFRGERPLTSGELLVQSDLALSLEIIAKGGAQEFYQGKICDLFLKSSKEHGGLLSKKDFAQYKTLVRAPVEGNFKEYKVYSMGPPSSGGIHVLQILGLVERTVNPRTGPLSEEAIHYTTLAMQRAFVDRALYLGDEDFIKVPKERLLSKRYLDELASEFSNKARSSSSIAKKKDLIKERKHTTHFSIMDREGNAVASTQTINGYFGAGQVVEGTGIVLNNEMDDFNTRPGEANLFGLIQGEGNALEAGKRPLSSMSPTLVFKDGKAVFALGSPNGPRIISCVAQTILNHLFYERPLAESVGLLRYHHQWYPDHIRVEEPGFSPQVVRGLRARGHQLNTESYACRVQAVSSLDRQINKEENKQELSAVSDPRGRGKALSN